MSSPVAALEPRRGVGLVVPAQVHERRVQHRVRLAWGLLVLNVLPFSAGYGIVHIPSIVGKAITQGALPAAFLVALTVNRRCIIRPSVFLCLMSVLAAEVLVTATNAQYVRGTTFRSVRFVGFIVVLWLLSQWWGRRDLLLVRSHITAYLVVLASVLLGLLVAPSRAIFTGRLMGIIWPIASTQVAHYAAVTTGMVIVLWLCGELRGRSALFVVVVAVTILLLSHTRTALVGLIAGLLVAGLSLIVAHARVRKVFAAVGVAAVIAVTTLSSFITAWLVRGQSASQLSNLSGRTTFWGPLLAFPRDRFQEIFGFGLSNGLFNGLPIDSNWLTSYQEEGLFGVTICVLVLLFLFVTAYFQPRGVQRALALFLLTYCLVASFTEVTFTDATTYLLDLTVAVSLLVPAARAGNQYEESNSHG
jgi:hypothetical protein